MRIEITEEQRVALLEDIEVLAQDAKIISNRYNRDSMVEKLRDDLSKFGKALCDYLKICGE